MELGVEDERLWQGLQINVPELGYIQFGILWLQKTSVMKLISDSAQLVEV